MLRYYANAPATTLANSCTSGATSIVVTAITGFPVSYPYTLILDRGLATEEVVSVTAGAGTTLTVTRGYDSTTAFAHSAGASVQHGFSAIDPREANAHVNASSGVHGLSGTVVGTTDTQTLTNKTLTDPRVSGAIKDSNGVNEIAFTATGSAVNYLAVANAATTGKPSITATGTDTNITLNIVPKGTGTVQANGVDVVTTTGTQTLTNKTLTSPTITTPKIDQINNSANNAPASTHESVASGVNYVRNIGNSTGNGVSVGAGGTDTNVSFNVFSKGTGIVTINGVAAVTTSGTQTLTNKTLSTGTVVGSGTDISAAWTSFTSTLTNVTLGTGGTNVGHYMQIGKTVHFRIVVTLGTGGALTGAMSVTVPVNANANHVLTGSSGGTGGGIRDASPAAVYPIFPEFASASTLTLRTSPTTAGATMVGVSATVPITFAVSDVISVEGTYEAA